MRHIDDGWLEAERLCLRRRRFDELGGGDEAAGNAPLIQGKDVMQTARRA